MTTTVTIGVTAAAVEPPLATGTLRWLISDVIEDLRVAQEADQEVAESAVRDGGAHIEPELPGERSVRPWRGS